MPVPNLLRNLGYFAAAAYLVIGIVGGLSLSHWEDATGRDQALWITFMVGGAILLVVGLRLFPRSNWGGAAAGLGGRVLRGAADFLDRRRAPSCRGDRPARGPARARPVASRAAC